MITLYNVISRDGFIAQEDGNENFIPENWWTHTLEMYKCYDSLVMGRTTYETMQTYPKSLLEPLEKLSIKKIVITHDEHFQPKDGYIVAHSPEEAFTDSNILVSSGPTLNTFLLEHKLVDAVIFHQLPVEIGEGIRPFSINTSAHLTFASKQLLADGVESVRLGPVA